jgi:glutathione S-transferase
MIPSFQTYFPHVDNIYSHRSTQRYKRKRFISHYWDCRLKGRPPGTPKTDDPGKKKRRRTARQRNLCDVKIKITEYFPGAEGELAQPDFGAGVDTMDFMDNGREPAQPFGVLAPSATLPADHPGAGGARYYTIQRVNGGASGKDSEGGGHKHTLEESDAIKKNSVKRKMLKEEKEKKKKTDVSVLFLTSDLVNYIQIDRPQAVTSKPRSILRRTRRIPSSALHTAHQRFI